MSWTQRNALADYSGATRKSMARKAVAPWRPFGGAHRCALQAIILRPYGPLRIRDSNVMLARQSPQRHAGITNTRPGLRYLVRPGAIFLLSKTAAWLRIYSG